MNWRDWIRAHRGARDLIVLEPSDVNFGVPARVTAYRGERPLATRFVGTLDAGRVPHVILAGLAEFLPQTNEDTMILGPLITGAPLVRSLAVMAAQIAHPDRIVIAQDTPLDQGGFPIGPEPATVDGAFAPIVSAAQRKAQWIRLLEACSEHEVPMDEVTFEGARLGSGRRLSDAEAGRAGLGGSLHVELAANTLMIVANAEPADEALAHALDETGAGRAVLVAPRAYEGLLCAFARQSGEEMGMGFVTHIDWEKRRMHALCTAVPPAPVRIVRLGTFRIDANGKELPEAKPWSV